MRKKVYAYIHTHWDREWYREYSEFRVRLNEVFNDVLKKLENRELNSFYFDGQTAAIEDYLEINPEKKELITKLIKEKKLFIGPYYCSTDSFLVDAESLIKNLQIGLKYSKEFQNKEFIAYHADTFGHSRYIPEIIKYFEINSAIFWRGLGELNSEFKFRDLNSIYLIEGYFHDYLCADVSIETKAKMLKRTLDRISKYSSEKILLPLGADHMGIPNKLQDQISKINELLDDYEIIISTPFEYIEKVKSNFKDDYDCEFRNVKRNFILPGVYSSRIDLKQENNKLQWKLSRIAQPLQAIANFYIKKSNFQKEIDFAYKELLKNHAHDSIYGCSIDEVHKENKQRYNTVNQLSNAVINSVKRNLFAEDNFSIINLSNFDYSGAIKVKTNKKLNKKFNAQLLNTKKSFPLTKVYDIHQVPITEDYTNEYEYLIDIKGISSFSQKEIDFKDINKESNLKISENSIENKNISLHVKNNQIEITNKINNLKICDFIKFVDRADIGDSYNFGALKNDKEIESKIVKTKIKEKGHIRSILTIDFEINIPEKSTAKGRTKKQKKHILKLDVILENQKEYIDFRLNWNNKSKNHLFQIEFNLNNSVEKISSDDLSGYITRSFDTTYNIYNSIPAPRGIELKHNTAPFQRFVATENSVIATKGLQEYEVNNNKLRVTLLRATDTISNPKNPTRGTPAGPPLPTPDLQMLGYNQAEFAFGFKNEFEEAEKLVESYYDPIITIESKLNDLTYFKKNKNVLVQTIKTNLENDLIIRFVNKTNKEQFIDFQIADKEKKVYITDANEIITSEYKDNKIAPNSFATLLIKN